jgi:hypothetical protein
MIESTVHTMPLDELRARAREAQRLIGQAREIARVSFDARKGAGDDSEGPPSDGTEGGAASERVGTLLDAAQRLLPGMPSLAEERAFSPRAKKPDTGWRRVTLRGGADRALETIERAEILDTLVQEAAGLIAEIERRSSSMMRVADVASERSEGSAGRRRN